MSSITPLLAIVIPAFKGEYLEAALQCIANQSDKRVKVYVGDDKSPDDLASICDKFGNQIDLLYHRFDENLGAHSLIKQWNRCVQLSNQPWVWLFSDDDEMGPDCVEKFYQAIEEYPEESLFRFDTSVIDEQSNIVRDNIVHPQWERPVDFVLARMKAQRSSFVSEYIFKRETFDRHNGFVEFPAAWCSDDASWVCFAEDNQIAKISDAKVMWRTSLLNISAVNSPHSYDKLIASLDYVIWLKKNIFTEQNSTPMERKALIDTSKTWFLNLLWKLTPKLTFKQMQTIAARMTTLYGNPIWAWLKLLKNQFRAG
ncbi:glycosyltransferase family 2 protein [Aliiglaciecola sp. 2_MG-2023]|uniref:glycosyltransferase family 2 protein n=1 Tax=unclassified Aliiglaciecola TaxID=2593648 RepID=UPI0026E2C28A|nr:MULTISPECIES: glycosyltransferase family 2 protein [unclassified Aliiglaciecola]MDO6709191.1 glycosyltransferase family 2 protein [Aliiglaciecola sp. 2_MG-2023]MDO6750339.1 glycosyltransferase family 2 protein [Aliiglaciecola sp. 1_MG-2023]